VVVADGQAAVAAAERQRFDLVLMDVQMPGMDGFAATAAIRAGEAVGGGHLPIVAMTAHALSGDEARCLAAGMDGYIAKPISAEAIQRELARLSSAAGADPDAGATGPATPLDLEAARHRVDGDVSLLEELARRFVSDYPEQVRILSEALLRSDGQRAEMTAHRLKGAVGTLGARRAWTLAEEVERLCQSARLGEATDAVDRLQHELDRIAVFVGRPGWHVHR
jgi:CheY-like chemotaxis protein/HPt (histidine-containing phosphotransfer) domain-containing protein